MFQAVIFDFDGVVLDSEPLHYKALSHIIAQFGLVLSYSDYVEKYLGLSDKDLFPKFFSEQGLGLSAKNLSALIHEKTTRYQTLIKDCDDLPMIDSVDQYISYLSEKKTKMAICSGSTRPEIMAVLAKLKQGQLRSYFSSIVSAEDVQRGKPSPEGYLLSAKRLKVAPDLCMAIEDTPHGIEAAKAAGIYVVALLTSYTEVQLQHADKIIKNFSQLILTTAQATASLN